MQDTDPAIDDILERHGITRRYWVEFYQLAEDGQITDEEFRTRLKHCVNYKAACTEIMELLSRPYDVFHSSTPTKFVSLDPENL